MTKNPRSTAVKLLAVLTSVAALSLSSAHAAEPKKPAPDPKASKAETARMQSLASQAKKMMAQDKELHAAVAAAIKAKDATKIQSLFRKKGLDLGPIIFSSNGHCVQLGPHVVICDT
jgi:hypothetical protein